MVWIFFRILNHAQIGSCILDIKMNDKFLRNSHSHTIAILSQNRKFWKTFLKRCTKAQQLLWWEISWGFSDLKRMGIRDNKINKNYSDNLFITFWVDLCLSNWKDFGIVHDSVYPTKCLIFWLPCKMVPKIVLLGNWKESSKSVESFE